MSNLSNKHNQLIVAASFIIGLFIILGMQYVRNDSLFSIAGSSISKNIQLASTIQSYVPLAPIPELTSGGSPQGSMLSTLRFLFRASLIIAIILSTLMIIVGGIQYMTTDAIQNKKDGKERIQSAIIGLVLAISAWTILNTINPRILNLEKSSILNPSSPSK
jgi:hypothetical protein